jgi:hypothetical protein
MTVRKMASMLIAVCLLLILTLILTNNMPFGIASDQSTPLDLRKNNTTLVVTTTADSGPGSLRQAITDAQSGDTITFDPTVFPPTTPVTIAVASELPPITQGNLTIDASNSGVIIDGTNTGDKYVNALQVTSNSNTIQGVQIINVSGAGIALCAGAQYNTIGGDRAIGAGPIGQGNLISKGEIGIGLWDAGTSYNTITGNLIGVDVTRKKDWGNHGSGVYICNDASYNTIGPDNICAYNEDGIAICGSDSVKNTITRNSVYKNECEGIHIIEGGNTGLSAPWIIDFDLSAGTVAGTGRCANCRIEIFSDNEDEGAIYEGETTADALGVFTLSNAFAFSGPYLTATATDSDGNTSAFSVPISGTKRYVIVQDQNNLPRIEFKNKKSTEIPDNRIGGLWSGLWQPFGYQEILETEMIALGLKRNRLAINSLDFISANWEVPELTIDPSHDAWITSVARNGVTITYGLSFWDKAKRAEGGVVPCKRFSTEQDIQRYLDFVRFIVRHFKDRISRYELWNEPNVSDCGQSIETDAYIKMVERVVPVIREEYPEAKIVVGSVTPLFERPPYYERNSREYLFDLLDSNIMPLVDAIAWHIGGPSPEPQYESFKDYYHAYPDLVQQIKDLASKNGFTGEFIADELNWRSPLVPHPSEPGVYSQRACAKYYARGIIRNLGMDVTVGLAGVSYYRPIWYSTVQNLCTIMAGAEPINLPVTIHSTAALLRTYSFSLPNKDSLVAVWTDGVAKEHDPGVAADIILEGFSGPKVKAVDVLHNFEQEMVTVDTQDGLSINNFLIKDYPILLRIMALCDGDVAPLGSRDGMITVGDALVALRFALGLETPTQEDSDHADVAPLDSSGYPNPDGQITVGDALVILRKALGIIEF